MKKYYLLIVVSLLSLISCNNDKIKVHVVGGYQKDDAYFIENSTLVNDISKADIVLFSGGVDIDPIWYGCKRHESTQYPNRYRDVLELCTFHDRIRKDQLVVGICRGAQLCCVAYGGRLIQNVDNHWESKHIVTNGEKSYIIKSIHHQMAYPFNIDSTKYKILYWSDASYIFEGDKIDKSLVSGKEPEVVLYSSPNLPECIAIQSHPSRDMGSEFNKVLNKLIYEELKKIK